MKIFSGRCFSMNTRENGSQHAEYTQRTRKKAEFSGAEHNWKAGTVEKMRSTRTLGGDQEHKEPFRLL